MRLQYSKSSKQFNLTIPKRYVKWLLWEKSDEIIVNLRQDNCSLELTCSHKSKIKEAIVKKERLQESISKEQDLRLQLQKHEEIIGQLHKDIANQELRDKTNQKKSEVLGLEQEKEENDLI